MSTDTITTDKFAAANERALRVMAAVADGYDTNGKLIEHLGLPKTTLLSTLAWLVEQGKIEKTTTEDRKVFYRQVDAYATRNIARDRMPNPDHSRLTAPTAYDSLLGAPDPRIAALLAKRAGAIVPQQGTAQPAEMPAAPRSARLPKGTQEAMILGYLADHPRDSFGPYELGRALAPAGHKALGLRDACARLAERGQILRVQDSPVRYAHRPNVREA